MSEEWLSITDAAARLTASGDPIDRSTLSRYLKRHTYALPLRNDGRKELVEINALLAHRAENIRVPAVSAQSRGARTGRYPEGFSTGLDGSQRKARADAELREMDLAERRRELVPVAEVDQAGRDAIALMRAAFERSIEEEAQKCGTQYGWEERQVRAALKGFVRHGIDLFHTEVLLKLDAMRRSEEHGEDEGHQGGARLQ